MKILVINGPNINMLGIREPDIYGNKTYAELVKSVEEYCGERGIAVKCFHSNHEGAIVDEIQNAYNNFDAIIINPAAYTHTSIAIPDALKSVNIPAAEVHISDISSRESFRQISYIRDYCFCCISGMGIDGYLRAIDRITEYFGNEPEI